MRNFQLILDASHGLTIHWIHRRLFAWSWSISPAWLEATIPATQGWLMSPCLNWSSNWFLLSPSTMFINLPKGSWYLSLLAPHRHQPPKKSREKSCQGRSWASSLGLIPSLVAARGSPTCSWPHARADLPLKRGLWLWQVIADIAGCFNKHEL